eukprot:482941_1
MVYRLLLLLAICIVLPEGVRGIWFIECFCGRFRCIMHGRSRNDQLQTPDTDDDVPEPVPTQRPTSGQEIEIVQFPIQQLRPKPQPQQARLDTPNIKSRPQDLPVSGNLNEVNDHSTLPESLSDREATEPQSSFGQTLSTRPSWSMRQQSSGLPTLVNAWSWRDIGRSNTSENITRTTSSSRTLINPGNPLQPPSERMLTVDRGLMRQIAHHCGTITSILPEHAVHGNEFFKTIYTQRCRTRYTELLVGRKTIIEHEDGTSNLTVVAVDLNTIVSTQAIIKDVHSSEDVTELLHAVHLINTDVKDLRYSVVQQSQESSTYVLNSYRSHFMKFVQDVEAQNGVVG